MTLTELRERLATLYAEQADRTEYLRSDEYCPADDGNFDDAYLNGVAVGTYYAYQHFLELLDRVE